MKVTLKNHIDHRQMTDDDLREAIDEAAIQTGMQSQLAKKPKVVVENPDAVPNFRRHLNVQNNNFALDCFTVEGAENSIRTVTPQYVVYVGEQLIQLFDYMNDAEQRSLAADLNRNLLNLRDYNRRIKDATEIANVRIRDIQARRFEIIRLDMLTPIYEETFGREIAAIIQAFADNVVFWHGIQTINIVHLLRIRRRQSMITWFRDHYYPVRTAAPPLFQDRTMILHMHDNPLSPAEQLFVRNPTVENLPTLEEYAGVVQEHDLTNNDIVDAMMGRDVNAGRMANQYEDVQVSIARGSVGDHGFRLRQVLNLQRVQPPRVAKNKQNKNPHDELKKH
jgi:hypothetical protein